jgi:hypothetical protein
MCTLLEGINIGIRSSRDQRKMKDSSQRYLPCNTRLHIRSNQTKMNQIIPDQAKPSLTEPDPQSSNRIPIPLPNSLLHLKVLRIPIPPIKHHTLPTRRKPVMQIKRKVPRALIARSSSTLPRSLTSQNLSLDSQDDRRVRVTRISVGERTAARAGVEDVVARVARLGDCSGNGRTRWSR